MIRATGPATPEIRLTTEGVTLVSDAGVVLRAPDSSTHIPTPDPRQMVCGRRIGPDQTWWAEAGPPSCEECRKAEAAGA